MTYNVADLVIPIPNFVPSPRMGLDGAYDDAHGQRRLRRRRRRSARRRRAAGRGGQPRRQRRQRRDQSRRAGPDGHRPAAAACAGDQQHADRASGPADWAAARRPTSTASST